jgi:hypothetical protein
MDLGCSDHTHTKVFGMTESLIKLIDRNKDTIVFDADNFPREYITDLWSYGYHHDNFFSFVDHRLIFGRNEA